MNGWKMERKLVTIRQINTLDPIPNADAIEVAGIEGWKVVVKKGQFHIGDYCVYFEIDSFLPENDPRGRYAFLMKSGVREMDGVRGHKLRTVKLRGQISQGLVLPLSAFPEIAITSFKDDKLAMRDFDLSEMLGIKKYEAPISPQLAGQVKGSFPSFIRKTDQERCQNLIDEIFWQNKNSRYEVTTKLDGTSVTYYHFNYELGACSRNLELKLDNEALAAGNKDNTIIKLMIDGGLFDIDYHGFAIQGELMGPGVQNNREFLKRHHFFVFDIQNLSTGEYLTPIARHNFMESLYLHGDGYTGIDQRLVKHVPIIATDVSLADLGISNID